MTVEVVENPEAKTEIVEEAEGESLAKDVVEGAAEEGDLVVTLGEEEKPPEEVNWVTELRRKEREQRKVIKELEAKLNATAPKEVSLGAKPRIEDFEYDGEEFEAALTAYHDKRRQIEAAHEQKRKAEDDQKQAWQTRLAEYGEKKAALASKVKDYDEAEELVKSVLSETQQSLLIHGAADPAMIVYALHKNPAEAQKLAAITDPVKFTWAAAQLETKMKVNSKKAPPPEKIVQGNGPISGTVDSTLDRLRAEAAKTGDFTKVHQYKQSKKA